MVRRAMTPVVWVIQLMSSLKSEQTIHCECTIVNQHNGPLPISVQVPQVATISSKSVLPQQRIMEREEHPQ
jgi:hypothetical protein